MLNAEGSCLQKPLGARSGRGVWHSGEGTACWPEVRRTHKCKVHVRVGAGRLPPAVSVWGLGMASLGLGHVRWGAMQLKQRTSVRESVTHLRRQDREPCNTCLWHEEQASVLWCCVSACIIRLTWYSMAISLARSKLKNMLQAHLHACSITVSGIVQLWIPRREAAGRIKMRDCIIAECASCTGNRAQSPKVGSLLACHQQQTRACVAQGTSLQSVNDH